MSNNPVNSLIELDKTFASDILDPRFNRFLFFTYTLEEDKILPLIPKTARAVIYYNKKVTKKIVTRKENVEFLALENHAKIYCMWGYQSVKCWIGSFNLTESGLFGLIEWAACFEGKLQKPLEIEDIIKTASKVEISDNIVVNQIFDLASSIINRDSPRLPDNLFNSSVPEPIIVHNLSSNTFGNALMR